MFKAEGGLAASMSTSGDLVYVHGSGDALMTLLDSQGKRIGGSAEKAMLLAKQSLMDPIDIGDLIARGAKTPLEKLRLEIFQRVNALGIGAQGLGGLTVLMAAIRRVFEAWWAPSDGSGPRNHCSRGRPTCTSIRSHSRPTADTRSSARTPQRPAAISIWWSSKATENQCRFSNRSSMSGCRPIAGRPMVGVCLGQSGQPQVYVRPFRRVARAFKCRRRRLQPRWAGDSRSLVYRGGDRLVKATLIATSGMTLARQDTLFEAKLISANVNAQFDIAANGTFVVARPASEDPEIIIVTDWRAARRARFGSGSRTP
jgi:hypothetical protein